MLKRKIAEKHQSTAVKDLIILITLVLVLLASAYFLHTFQFIVTIFQESPATIENIDEILVVLLTVSIGLAVFSWRRFKEFEKEADALINEKEESLKIAEMNAEVERIIGKQLRSDMEGLKKEIREIHWLLQGKK
jgi:hypothetical protein